MVLDAAITSILRNLMNWERNVAFSLTYIATVTVVHLLKTFNKQSWHTNSLRHWDHAPHSQFCFLSHPNKHSLSKMSFFNDMNRKPERLFLSAPLKCSLFPFTGSSQHESELFVVHCPLLNFKVGLLSSCSNFFSALLFDCFCLYAT